MSVFLAYPDVFVIRGILKILLKNKMQVQKKMVLLLKDV